MQIRSTAVDANSNGMESAHVKKAILATIQIIRTNSKNLLSM
jgi:hypothetical protein